MMAAYKEYKDELSPRGSGSVDSVEMQERDDDSGQDQEERLLAGDEGEATGDIEYKVEWHLRTGWAIAGSVLAALLVFIGLVLFTKLVIVEDRTNIEEPVGIGSFRRPVSDYVLDPSWSFNAAPQVREYKWTVVDIVGNPDGVFREMITINGKNSNS